ncbi:site-specific integrase [Bernardetia sp.]|uniref:site-specific integrase n=1 Tax=Bernardetia sp. TaxID=1937974 RepID=UPI0025C42012|nr:site-specific integrase [Bernardetia sp.]
MANANIYIIENEPNKQGACKLMLFFSYKGKRLMMTTGERCLPEHFDKKKQRVNKKHPFQIETNSILNNLCESVESHYKQFIAKGKVPSVQELRSAVKPKEKKELINGTKISMADYFDLFERHLISQRRSRSTKYKYRTLQRMFSKYQREKKEKIDLSTFDEITHTKFINWCIYDLDNAPSTIGKRNGFIKAFFAFCERNEANVHPYYKSIKIKKVDAEMIFLNEDELKKIEDIQVESYLEKTKDCFLFSCYTGLRYSDIEKLTLDHIQLVEGNYILELIQEKTNKKISIALSNKAVEIMNKYKYNVLRSQKNKHFLPVITNQKLNAYLKDLGRIAEIDTPVEKIVYQQGEPVKVIVPKYELLTFHKARHTFATLSLQRGMPLAVLQKILGHRRIEETMIYAKVVDTFQHDQLLKTWNNDNEEKDSKDGSKKMEQVQKEVNLEELTNQILKANEAGQGKLTISYPLSENTVSSLEQKGFVIQDTSPIEKLKGMYHTISW